MLVLKSRSGQGFTILEMMFVIPPTPVIASPSQVAPPQSQVVAPPTPSVPTPQMIDTGWYANLDRMNEGQLLQWILNYMYKDMDAQMVANYYPTRERRLSAAQRFQERHTPPIAPASIPLPQAVKVPPLSQQEQNAVDSMSRDDLLDWVVQNMYSGYESTRSIMARYSDDELRQMVRDAQKN